jgi:multimeric flavodoxin WrbA|tara:strand:+ start:449 stop:1102 length:654 start_codon:yes stop_codon:yes gene_type:complete
LERHHQNFRFQEKTMALTALALNATLKSSGGEPSSTDRMLGLIDAAMKPMGVTTTILRLADYNIKPGVSSDEGEGDDWPKIRQMILDADILIMGTPIWMGQPSSVSKRALERMDAFLSETDDEGRMVSYGRVAAVAVVGNEDGAHHVSAEFYQALSDVGFTIPANAVAYWVGAAMQSTNFADLEQIPEKVTSTVAMLARNTVHLATLLKANQYPGEA